MRVSGSVVFTGLLTVFFLVFGIIGAGYIHKAWIYPALAGSVGFFVTLVQLVKDLRSGGRVQSTGFDIEAERSVPTAVLYERGGRFLGWILGYYVGIWLIGFKLATVLFLILFLRMEGHVAWKNSFFLSMIMFMFLIVFEILLGLYWPDNLLQTLVGLPYLN
jgi:hypothetical protein